MASDGMFVEQTEPDVVVKVEPTSSTFKSDGRPTPARTQPMDIPVIPVSQRAGCDQSSRNTTTEQVNLPLPAAF
jgi:hypothetical protein